MGRIAGSCRVAIVVVVAVLAASAGTVAVTVPAAATPPPGTFDLPQVDTTRVHTCGLRADSTAVCWGFNDDGRSTPPAGTFTQITTGFTHTCAIRADDGTVDCWGTDIEGSTSPLAGVFTQIDAGGSHTCGIRPDETVACWGQDDDLEVSGTPTGTFDQISAGQDHSCGVRSDGTIECWGDNLVQQSTEPAGQFTQVSAGELHSCGRRVDSTITCWGSISFNRLDAPSGSFEQVSAGGAYSCAVRVGGDVVCWGDGAGGFLGPPAGAFSRVSAGSTHACGIRVGGTVACWGLAFQGQGNAMMSLTPFPSPGDIPGPGEVGVPYSHTFLHTFMSGTVTFAVTAGSLPPGLSLHSSTGVLSGTPTVGGTFGPITVEAANGFTPPARRIFTIDVTSTTASTETVLTSGQNPSTYGGATTLTATVDSEAGTPTGSVTFTEGSTTICAAVPLGPSATATCVTPVLGAGTHQLTATYLPDSSSFAGSSGLLDQIVSPAGLQVTASDGSMTYGGTAPTITPSYAGFVNGDDAGDLAAAPVCSTTATSASAVGSHPSTCSGAVTQNYVVDYRAGTVTVHAAGLTITASDAAMTYGGTAPAVTPNYSGFVGGDDASALTTPPTCGGGSPATPAGTHATTCSGAVAPNYEISYVDGELTVARAPLTVTASDESMIYGAPAPTVTPSYSGFVNGDDASDLTTAPTCAGGSPTTPVGTYAGATSCSGAAAANYTIAYVPGDLTVTRAVVLVTASDASMTYGSSGAVVTPSYSGFVNGDDASDLTAPPICGGGSATTPVGTYPGATSCSGAVAANYWFGYVAGDLTVGRAVLQITASDASMIYGAAGAVVTPSYSGFVDGDDASDLTAPPICGGGSATTPVGTYAGATSCSGAVAANYTIAYVPGDLTVTEAILIVTASDASMIYGAAAPTVTPSYSGFLNGDDASDLTTAPTCGGGSPATPVGTHATACSGGAAANYAIGYIAGTLTVAKAPLTITASDASMVYGSAGAAVTPSYTGLVNGENAAVLTALPTCAGGSATAPVGSYPGATSCSGATAANYEIGYVAGTLTVTRAQLTITASDASMTYGASAPAVTPSFAGFVGADDASVLTTAPTCGGGSPTTPAGTHTTSCSGAAAANYEISYVDGELTVAKAPLTITASDASMVYGSAGAVVTPSYSGFVNGDDPSDLAPAPTCGGGAPTTPAGTYEDGTACSGAFAANYEISYVDGELTVAKAPLTITASDASMVYGSAGAVVTPSYSGFVNGDDPSDLDDVPSCGGGSATTPVGAYAEATSCSGAAARSYEIGYVDGTLTVTRAPLTITASDASMVYGASGAVVTPSYSGFVNGEGASDLTAAAACAGGSATTPAGTYPGGTSCSGAVAANYDVAYVAGTLTVDRAALVVTASDASMTYGGAAPTVTPSYSGFVNGDDPSDLLALPTCAGGSAATPAGTHEAGTTCSGAGAANYDISYVAGTLVVGRAPLMITASDGSMTYGGTVPTVTPAYVGFVNGEGPAVLDEAPTCGGGAATTPAGAYAGATSCSGAAAANYDISYVAGTLTVAKAPLVVTASDASMTYGASAPVVTPGYSGFVNGEGAAVLTTAPTCGGGSPTTPAGTHPGATTCSGATASNYDISHVAGTLTVAKAALLVTAEHQTKGYGQPVPALTYTVSGFVNGQDASVLSGAPSLSTPATASSDVGTYPIVVTAGSLSAANYRFVTVNGLLTISRAATQLVAAPAVIQLMPLRIRLGTVSARLTYGPTGTPAVGQMVTFTAGDTHLCTVPTDADGTAGCSLVLSGALAVTLQLGYTATFTGSPNLLPSTAEGPLAS